MKLLDMIQQVLMTKTITAEMEQEIRSLLWNPNLTSTELEALDQLTDAMAKGTVEYLPPAQQHWFAA